MREPLVSVLIPCYNSEKYIDETLQSVLAQTYGNIEIIVVDDGSTDNSCGIIEKYVGQRGLSIYRQENQGACVARNRALLESTGDYIQYLDADDLLSKDKISSQMRLANKWGEDYLYSCRWDRFSIDPTAATFPFRVLDIDFDKTLEWFTSAYSNNEMIASSSWLLSRKLGEQAGKWNESLTLSQDGEYFARVITKAKGIKFDPDGKVYYRSNIQNSISSKYNCEHGIESNFAAIESIEKALIDKYGNVDQIKGILANKYQSFIYRSYPKKGHLLKIANEKIRTLGGADLKPPFKGKTLLLSRVLGWRFTKLLKNIWH